MSSKDVEIQCEILIETELAYKISDGDNQVWIPKSQVKDSCEENGQITSIFISEWLATEKGLV